ncbi:MAG: hypothetical protein KF726_23580 [Anaerolineae bacterium]|nr:hypothetical protein [Anaerolineae bacterium]
MIPTLIPALFVWLMVIPLAAAPFIYLVGRLSYVFAAWQAGALPQQSLRLRGGNGHSASIHSPMKSPTINDDAVKRDINYVYMSAVITLAVMWIAFIFTAREFIAEGAINVTVGMVVLRFDGLSLLVSALALSLSTLVTLFSDPVIAGEVGEEKYYALLVILTGAMIGLACAGDLFNLWIWFELMAVSSYFLVAFYRAQRAPLEALVKYLVQSATGSALILFGIALVLAQTGTLTLDRIEEVSSTSIALLAAGALFIVGFGVKVALVPMHTWLPDAHAHAPSGISAMLSGVVIETGLVALLRTLAALSGVTLAWGTLLMSCGVVNMCVGNLLAIRQTQVKRLLAFSSIAQIGYMLLGLGIGISAGQIDGVQGGVFHLLTHGLMKGLAFLAAGALLYALYSSRGDHSSTLTINDLSGATRRYPLTAFALSIAVLGLGGLPPLAGFMSKWQIFSAGFMTQNPLIAVLVIVAAFNSVISLTYYAPLVNVLYRRQESSQVKQGQTMPVLIRIPLVVLSTAVIGIGIYPPLLNWLTGPAATALMTAFSH